MNEEVMHYYVVVRVGKLSGDIQYYNDSIFRAPQSNVNYMEKFATLVAAKRKIEDIKTAYFVINGDEMTQHYNLFVQKVTETRTFENAE